MTTRTDRPEQLGLDLAVPAALGRADFLVAEPNAMVFGLIDAWESWSPRKLVLAGPEGSGKTHLAHVWAAASGARIVAAPDLAEADIPRYAGSHVAVEDVHRIAGNQVAQTALFHLHNLVLAEGHALLMTGRGAPPGWAPELPDLQSRIDGTQAARLAPPDDALLAAVLAKLLADRQLTPKPDLIPYLVNRIDRSFAAARRLVVQLDAASLAQKRPVTRQLAAAVLDKHADIG